MRPARIPCVSNPQKAKGDRFERKALGFFKARVPDLLVERPDRELGAGRLNDRGDLDVLPDCAVQVKAMEDTVRALNLAASGAERQRHHRGADLGLGMVPVPRARPTAVAWVLCSLTWPAEPEPGSFLICGIASRAIERVRDEAVGIPRHLRLAVVRRAGAPDLWVGPFEAWEAAYRARRGALAPAG